MSKSLKILVVRFSSIGDIVLTTPVLRILKNQLNAEVHYLTKKERFAAGLPPNKYNEQMSRLSMDPILGEPNERKLHKIQDELRNFRMTKSRASIVPVSYTHLTLPTKRIV